MPIISYFPVGTGVGGTGVCVSAVSNISTQTASGRVYIKWTDPEDVVIDGTTLAAWAGTLLVRKAGSMPTNRRDGTVVLDSKIRNEYQNTYFCDSGMSDGVTYYYKFYPYTEAGDYTERAENEFYVTPAPVLLGNVSNMSANAAGNGSLAVRWTDPASAVISDGIVLATWASTKVVYKTDGYPTSPDDGILAVNCNTYNAYSSEPYIINGLDNGTVYYIAFFPITTDGAATVDSANRVSGIPSRTPITTVPSMSNVLTYDGNILSPSWNDYDPEQLILGGVTSAVNAGTYIATFTPTDAYEWADGSLEAKEIEWSIGKAEGSLTVSPTFIVLNNSNLTSVIGVTRIGDGEITATSSANGIATAVVSGTNITISHVNKAHGSAVITVKVGEGTNYFAPADVEIRVIANFPKIEAVPTQSGSLVYTGGSLTPSWDGYDTTQLSIGGDTSGVNAGVYTATFTPIGDYSWSDGTTLAKSVTWTINKAVISTVPSQSGTLTYTGSSQTPSWKNYDSAKMTLGGTTSGTNAGSYNAKFTPRNNYEWSGGDTGAKTVSWSIGKAYGSLSITPTSLVLNSDATSGTIEVTRAGDGAIRATSSNTSVATVSVSGTTITVNSVNETSGTAHITVSVAEGTNHYASSEKGCSVSAEFIVVPPLEDTSWADISNASKSGQASNYWAVGDQKNITVNGVTYAVDIIGFDHDVPTDSTTYGRSKAGITFQLHDLLATTYKMNSSDTNSGGWESSAMRTSTMTTLLNQLASDLKTVIVPVNKLSGVGGGASSGTKTVSDSLFLLAEIEVFGSAYSSVSGEGTQYAYYKNGGSKIKNRSGSADRWWLRSPCPGYSNRFCGVVSNGAVISDRANNSRSVSFGFCV